jgi:hypothetical protein
LSATVVLTVLGGVIGAAITAVYQMLSMRSARMSATIDRQLATAQREIDREEAASQREIDRKIEVRNKRMTAYERYLAAFHGVNSLYSFEPQEPQLENSEKVNSEKVIKAVNEYWLAYGSLFQIASDAVLIAVTDFHKVGYLLDTTLTLEAYDEEFRDLYATMIIEMRKNAFEETMLQKEFIRDRLPSSTPQAYRGR